MINQILYSIFLFENKLKNETILMLTMSTIGRLVSRVELDLYLEDT